MRIFCSLFCILIIAAGASALTQVSEIKITFLNDKNLQAETSQDTENDLPDFREFEIFDIYEKTELIDGQPYYLDYIDSVYLEKKKGRILIFNYMWEGEKKNLKEGYYLVPTGQVYTFDSKKVQQLIDAPGSRTAGQGNDFFNFYLFAGPDLLYFTNISASSDMEAIGFGFEASALIELLGTLGLKAVIANNINFASWDFIVSAEFHINSYSTLLGIPSMFYMGIGKLFSFTREIDLYAFAFDLGVIGLIKINDNRFFNNISIDLFIRGSVYSIADFIGNGTYGIKVGFRL